MSGARVSRWLCGIVLFVGFPLVMLGHLKYQSDENETISFFEKFVRLPPNEIGDTFAGLFGSLAFLAAVVAIAMQSRELAAQREELTLTRREYERQRKATEEMAKAMRAQASVFEDEKNRRLEERNQQLFEEKIISMTKIMEKRLQKVVWCFATNEYDIEAGKNCVTTCLSPPRKDYPKDEDWIAAHVEHFRFLRSGLDESRAMANAERLPLMHSMLFADVKAKADEMIALSDGFAEAEIERLDRLRLNELKSSLLDIVNDAEYWQ